MKDFGRWFKEQALPLPAAGGPKEPTIEDQIEALGLDLMVDESVWGECCCCGKRMCLTDFLTKEEIARDIDPFNLHCGGSPRCCP